MLLASTLFSIRVSVPLRGFGYETGYQCKIHQITNKLLDVSVPLRGFGYETLLVLAHLLAEFAKVSVPLRGFGYETHAQRNQTIELELKWNSFRPLAGIWL